MNKVRHPIPDIARVQTSRLDARIAALGVQRFESAATVQRRQQRMLHCAGADLRFRDIAACDCRHGPPHWRDCSAACHLATRLFRAELLLSEPAVFALEGHHPVVFFTVVPSRWRQQVDALDQLDPRPLAAELARALRGLDLPALRASFDIELNLCEEGTEQYWTPHAHGLGIGASLQEISTALRPVVTDDLNPRPLKLRCVRSTEIPVLLNYASKRVDVRKIQYFKPSGRPRWRKLPLRRPEQLALDAWRCGFPVGFTHTRVGFKRNGAFLVPTS